MSLISSPWCCLVLESSSGTNQRPSHERTGRKTGNAPLVLPSPRLLADRLRTSLRKVSPDQLVEKWRKVAYRSRKVVGVVMMCWVQGRTRLLSYSGLAKDMMVSNFVAIRKF